MSLKNWSLVITSLCHCVKEEITMSLKPRELETQNNYSVGLVSKLHNAVITNDLVTNDLVTNDLVTND